jgi:hypothetical protein
MAPRPGSWNPTHIPTDEQLDRERKVLELRRAGYTFDAIARSLDPPLVDRSAARKVFQRALARPVQEAAVEVRELEADRLDRLQVSVWTKAIGGDVKALDRVLSIMRQRAELLGLNHSHGIAERALQLEAAKVRLVALAFGKVLDELGLSPEQRERASRVLLTELRALEAADEEPPPPPPGDGPPPVVSGEAS